MRRPSGQDRVRLRGSSLSPENMVGAKMREGTSDIVPAPAICDPGGGEVDSGVEVGWAGESAGENGACGGEHGEHGKSFVEECEAGAIPNGPRPAAGGARRGHSPLFLRFFCKIFLKPVPGTQKYCKKRHKRTAPGYSTTVLYCTASVMWSLHHRFYLTSVPG